jgi:hypothetical protein
LSARFSDTLTANNTNNELAMSIISITKKNGSTERLNLKKIHRVITWATEGLNISPMELTKKVP